MEHCQAVQAKDRPSNMPTPCTVTGTLNQLSGGLIGQGKILFQLTNIGTGNPIGVTGTSIIPQLTYSIVTAQNGTFTVSLWGNDNINPANTLYSVTFFDSFGNSMGPVLYNIIGASFNLNTALAAGTISPPILFPGPAIVANPTAPQTITGQPLTLTSTAPLVTQGSISETNAGVFTNTQMNEYCTSMLNGISPATQFFLVQGGNFSTDAIAGGVAVPAGATVHNANAIAGYATSAADSASRTKANTVAIYGQAVAAANGAGVWGWNVVAEDTPGSSLTGTQIIGGELDIGASGSPAFVQGITINQGGSGTAPALSPAFLIHHTSGTFNLNQGYVVDRLGIIANGPGVLLDGNGFGGSNPSFPIAFNAYDAGNALQQATIRADLNGNLQFNPSTGNAYFFNKAGGGLSLPGSTSGFATIVAPATGGVSNTAPSVTGTLTVTIGSGTASMTTALIGTGACGTTVSVGATGVLTTDAIAFSFNGIPPAGTTSLIIQSWPTAGNVNFQYCNPTAGNQTPGAATLNWRVTR